jgi:teichuronic acid biosynthesis glycosyltransferase TuaC
MRIAIVTTSWPDAPGDPAGHFVWAEALELERSGHEVAVLAPPVGGAFGWPGVAARVRQRPVRAIGVARWAMATRMRLVGMNADRIIAHWAVPCGLPIAAGACSAALEVVSHGGDVRLLAALPRAARNLMVGALATRAERWRFVSAPLLEALLAGLDRKTRAGVERIAAIQAAAIEMPDVSAAVRQRRRELGSLRVGVSVGRLVASKCVDRAIEHVAGSSELDALVIVGDGPDRGRLERLARASNADVRFTGVIARPDALAWIGAADMLLQASRAEGLSTVVREAEALGTRVRKL